MQRLRTRTAVLTVAGVAVVALGAFLFWQGTLMQLHDSPQADASPPLPFEEEAPWKRFFAAAEVTGTIAVIDEQNGRYLAYNLPRAQTRMPTASTFKIPHTLFALDADVVRDEFEILKWDGQIREFPSWNADQTLRSAMRNSTVWVFQGFARALGEARERAYLRRLKYGNADSGGGVEQFWLNGTLRISATEQLEFLQKLYRNQLPFKVADQRLVKDLMIVEASRSHILRAKSGWSMAVTPHLGWWVGYVERPEGVVFFALNIDMPNGSADAPKREGLVREVLRHLDALP